MGRGFLPLTSIAGFLLAGCAFNYNRRFDSSWQSINGEVTLKMRGTCPPNVDTRDEVQKTLAKNVAQQCGLGMMWVGDSPDPATIQCVQGYFQAVLRGECVYTSRSTGGGQ